MTDVNCDNGAVVGSFAWLPARDVDAAEQDEFSFSSLLLLSPSSSPCDDWSTSSSCLSTSPPVCLSLPLSPSPLTAGCSSPAGESEDAECCHTAELRTESPVPDSSFSSLSSTGDADGIPGTDSDSPQLVGSPRRAQQQQQQWHQLSSASAKGKTSKRKRRLPIASSSSASPCPPPSPSPSARCCSELLSEAEKRERNKQSASDYRKRRKLFVSSLEKQLQQATDRLSEAQQQARRLTAENSSLRQTISVMRQRMTTVRDTAAAQRSGDQPELSGSAGTQSTAAAAVCPLIPPQFRPTPPSLSAAAAGGCAAAVGQVRRSSRRAKAAEAAGSGADSLRLSSLCMFVLFSCFLLYLPFITQHDVAHWPGMGHSSSSSEQPPSFSAFPRSEVQRPPDCSLSSPPPLCHRGRTILALEAEAESGQLREEALPQADAPQLSARNDSRAAVNESAGDGWLPRQLTASPLSSGLQWQWKASEEEAESVLPAGALHSI